jgi:hypothetical protein
MLRPTASQPACLGIKHPSAACDKIFVSVWQLRVCLYGELSLTGGRVCPLRLLLTLASAVILGSDALGTRYHILLSKIRDFSFHLLLRLAGLSWSYPTLSPHWVPGFLSASVCICLLQPSAGRSRRHLVESFSFTISDAAVVSLFFFPRKPN